MATAPLRWPWAIFGLACVACFPGRTLPRTVPTPAEGAGFLPPDATLSRLLGDQDMQRGVVREVLASAASGAGLHLRKRSLLEASERRQADAFELSSMTSSQGLTVYGEQGQVDRVGVAVANLDVNGDRIMDFAVGAFNSAGAGNAASGAGEVLVIFGRIDGWASSVDPTSLDGTSGFVIHGGEADDHAGNSVGGGDVNGDGYDDVIVGQYLSDSGAAVNAGGAFVVFGKGSNFAASVHPSELDGTNGFRIVGFDLLDAGGWVVTSADLNADGFADVVVGAPDADGQDNGAADAGQVVVVFGRASGFGADVDVASLDGSNGVVIYGKSAGDRLGWSLASCDVNGDGLLDLAIGARWGAGAADASQKVGEVYTVLARAGGWPATFALAGLAGTDGFVMYGQDAVDNVGWSLACADVNGDSIPDIVVGAPGKDGATNLVNETGGVYVVFGRESWGASLLLSGLDGTTGFKVVGRDADDWTGYSVGAGDMNGDKFAEVLIGAHNGDGSGNTVSQSGEVVVLYGKGAGWAPTVDIATLSATGGRVLYGREADDRTGWALSVGDVNGDSFGDAVIGASGGDGLDNNVNAGGEAYVLFGAPPSLACPRGQFDENLGRQGPAVCVQCTAGYWCSGIGSRILCPERFTTRPGAAGAYNCSCSPGYVVEGALCVVPTPTTTPPPTTPAPVPPGPDVLLISLAVLLPLLCCCLTGLVCIKTDQVRKFRAAFELRDHLKEANDGGDKKTAWDGGELQDSKGGSSSWRGLLGTSPSGHGRSLRLQQESPPGRVPITGGWKSPAASPFKTKVKSISPEAAAVNAKSPKSPKSPNSPTKKGPGGYSPDRARAWAVVSPMARFMPPPTEPSQAAFNTTPTKSPSHPKEVELLDA